MTFKALLNMGGFHDMQSAAPAMDRYHGGGGHYDHGGGGHGWHGSSKKGGGGNSGAALSALTLLAFLFLMNVMQQSLMENNATETTTTATTIFLREDQQPISLTSRDDNQSIEKEASTESPESTTIKTETKKSKVTYVKINNKASP